MRSSIPEKRFDIPFCRPKPIPKPMAPPKTAKRERSIPADVMPMSSAMTIRTTRTIFAMRTWDERVRPLIFKTRRSANAETNVAK